MVEICSCPLRPSDTFEWWLPLRRQSGSFNESCWPGMITHARDLPWRQSADPYRIWVSEIMLQQTRVAAVLDYYARFLILVSFRYRAGPGGRAGCPRRLERPRILPPRQADAQGAQSGRREHRGAIPRTAEQLRKLPGIGEYTSSAIASIAFGEPVAVVDGNVERVLLRVFPDDEKPPAAAPNQMASRPCRQPPRCPASRRLQPGDDGIGSHRLPAPAAHYASTARYSNFVRPAASTRPRRPKRCAPGRSPTHCCAAIVQAPSR